VPPARQDRPSIKRMRERLLSPCEDLAPCSIFPRSVAVFKRMNNLNWLIADSSAARDSICLNRQTCTGKIAVISWAIPP
jgi:hypothetical protein